SCKVPLLTAPASARATRVDMDVIGAGMSARVNHEAPQQLYILDIDNLYREPDQPAVERSVLPIPVRVHDYVGGVTILVLTVAGSAGDSAVGGRRPESGVDIECQAHRRIGAMPALDLRDHELELVE